MKVCSKCKVEKENSEFHKWGRSKDRLQNWCKKCNSDYMKEKEHFEKRNAKRKEERRNNPELRAYEVEKIRGYRQKNPEKYMFQTVRNRAKDLGVPFNITVEDIKIPEFCPILGVKLTPNCLGKKNLYVASLDRIIPELGYVKGNVAVISKKANMMKHNASLEEIQLFAKNILEYIKQTLE